MMLVAAMLLLIRGPRQASLVQYASIPLAFAFVIRPTAAIPIYLTYFVAFNFELLGKLGGLKLWALRSCIVLLAAASMIVHGHGAISWAPYVWNNVPDNIDLNPARLWDWRDPQFARGWPTFRR